MTPPSAINLVLSMRRHPGEPRHEDRDLREILRRVRELDPGIHTHLLKDRRRRRARARLALRPTLFVGFGPLKRLRPFRGALTMGASYTKSEEYRRLEQHSLPVPEWMLESELDLERLAAFGPYVVRKPNIGGRGHQVVIKKADRLRPPSPPPHERADRIVQRFVYTGRWPSHYRVDTCFGRCLCCFHSEADRDRRPLEGPTDFASAGGKSIVSGGRGCTITLSDDKEVIELGERAHQAFPDHPLLGVDIARERSTGKLFILEVNAVGKIWPFGPGVLRSFEEGHGIRLDEQFDALDRAARVLAREARQRAR
jgi:hypothetical protein